MLMSSLLIVYSSHHELGEHYEISISQMARIVSLLRGHLFHLLLTIFLGDLTTSNTASVRVISINLELSTLRQHLVLVGSVLPIFLVHMTRL